jgi:hypothetical protein
MKSSVYKPFWALAACLTCLFSSLRAQTPLSPQGTLSGRTGTQPPSGTVIRNFENRSQDSLILEYSHSRSKRSSREQDPRRRHDVELAKAPTGGTYVPTFATELSAAVMNEELKQKIDEEYMRNLRSYMYFHGYQTTSLDARSRTMYNINEEEELKVRREMAVSVRNYMLSRGIPRFLSSREQTKRIGDSYQKVVNSTHLSFQLTNPPASKVSTPPWTLKTGLDPFRAQIYARVTNQLWSVEGKQDLRKYKNVDFLVARTGKKRSVGSRYNMDSRDLTPFMTYAFTRNLNGGLDTTLPFRQEKILVHTVTRISMSYAF